MRDMFDDFMEELRRREAIARGETPPERPTRQDDGDDPHGDDPHDDGDDHDGDEDREREDVHQSPHADGADGPDRPEPLRPSRQSPGGGTGRGGRRGDAGRRSGAPADGRRRWIGTWLAIAVGIGLLVLLTAGLDLWTDALWFTSIHFDAVFWTRIGAQGGLFAGGVILALVVLLGNLWLADRLSPPPTESSGAGLGGLLRRVNEAAQANTGARRGRYGGPGFGEPRTIVFEPDDLPDLTPLAGIALVIVGVLIALTVGGSLSTAWETVLLWIHRVPFSPDAATPVTDPVFGRDISFFLFELPFLRLVQGLFNGLVIAALILVAIRYVVSASRGGLALTTPIRVHLAVLGGLFLLSVAFGYQLDKLDLVYSDRGVATGVSFTDQNAQFLAYDVLTVISGLAAAFLVGGAFTRLLWPLGLTMLVWFLASIVVGRVYPEAVQRLTVVPNQFAQEQRYIANNISMTRLAYGIDTWQDRPFGGEQVLTQAQIDADADTFRNARLWDYRPLGSTLDQLQTVRRYYDFTDVDTDRYVIDGVQRQVMLAGRELALEQNPNATGWVNQRILFTHGIGAAMVPVNEVVNEGQPRLFIGNLPPVSTAGAPQITQPRIYFGERDAGYVIVGAKQAEFDYPTGEGDQGGSIGTETRWTGTDGIHLDSTLMRLLFAARFRDLDLLISDQLTPDSQLLFHRTLSDRLGEIAPFLRYDQDPYLVVADGRLVYVQDAYTVTDRFPNAQATDLDGEPIDYIRNSVKVTMDAYDGTMHFYVSDPSDPLVRAYESIFPTLFEPMSALPATLIDHLRVPEGLFNVQTRMFGKYHVTDPQQFFRTDDQWTVPQGQTSEQTLPSEAYYVVMRMPGESKAEFLLLQPMVPTQRPNMIAWVAARMDPPNYGTTRVYRFPADTTIFGPAQIEARIDQDPIISQQITLWSQAGSTVVRGNLIVVPVGDSLLYLQPVYLQSTGVAIPEFQRIVVASPREVVWGTTLGEGLRLLLEAEASSGNGPSPSPGTTPTPTPGGGPSPTPTASPGGPLPSDVPGLIAYAKTHFDAAQAALRAGDFAGYGAEIAKVQAALDRLDALTPGVAPSSAPSAAPSPSSSPAP